MTERSLTIVCHNLKCGGTEKVIIKLANKYHDQAGDVTIICLEKASKFYSYKLNRAIRVIELDGINNRFNKIFLSNQISLLKKIIHLRLYMMRNSERVFLSFLSIPSILTIIARIGLGIKLFASERVDPKLLPSMSFHWKLLRKFLYPQINGLIVQTEEIASYFKTHINVPKVIIIPNSVSKITSQKAYDGLLQRNNLKLLYIGRLEYQKGLDILIPALDIISLKSTTHPFEINIVGNGSLKEYVSHSINSLALRSWAKLYPETTNVEAIIDEADLILLPSRYEGMSNVLLETMARGKCVLASHEASSQLIEDQVNGFLLPCLTAQDLAFKLIDLHNNKKLFPNIGCNAKLTAEKYTDEKIFTLWDKALFN